MKKLLFLAFAVLSSFLSHSQTNIDQILEIGVENAERFSEDYFDAAGEALINNLSNGWYTTAEVKRLWDFEVGFVGNLSFIRDEKQSFIFNTNEYENVTLASGFTAQFVSNAFGVNEEDVVVRYQDEFGSVEITLPDGIGEDNISMAPTGYLQASMGISKSTEIKVRALPRFEVRNNTEVQLYGVAFQHELTDWIFSWKRLPFKVSGLIGFTNVKGFYDFSEDSSIDGEDQEIKLNSNSWLITGIISTKLPVLNFYGGFGYYFGTSTADILGTYQIRNGPLTSQLVTDPISVKNNTSGLKATLGLSVKFGVFKANLDYSLQNYQNFSLGLSVGW